jgi:hypothetical protein
MMGDMGRLIFLFILVALLLLLGGQTGSDLQHILLINIAVHFS